MTSSSGLSRGSWSEGDDDYLEGLGEREVAGNIEKTRARRPPAAEQQPRPKIWRRCAQMNRVWEASYLGWQVHLQEKQTKQTAAGREIHGLCGKFTVLDSISSLGPASAAVWLSPSYVTVTPNNVRTHPPPPLQPPAFLGPENRAHTRPWSSPVDGLLFLACRTRLFPFGKADKSYHYSLIHQRTHWCTLHYLNRFNIAAPQVLSKFNLFRIARVINAGQSVPKVEPAVLKAEQGVSKVGQRIPMLELGVSMIE
ncbi:hypothetical protein F4604DRAFT_1686079 [Suillus subluteus]|nr:hypothetical protein F4604DRAFT_1686079 [Suillus subluteus]